MLLFLVDLINIEIFRISFSFFYSFSFILRSRATSEERSGFRKNGEKFKALLVEKGY